MSFNIKNKSIVSIIMGSKSDWVTLKKSAEILKKLKIQYSIKIVSAHRTPMRLVEFAKSAKKNNIAVIIAGAEKKIILQLLLLELVALLIYREWLLPLQTCLLLVFPWKQNL